MWNKRCNYHQHLSDAPQADQLTAHLRWSMKLSKVFYCSSSLPHLKDQLVLYPAWEAQSLHKKPAPMWVHYGLCISKRNLVINCQKYSVTLILICTEKVRWHLIPEKSETIAAAETAWNLLWYTPFKGRQAVIISNFISSSGLQVHLTPILISIKLLKDSSVHAQMVSNNIIINRIHEKIRNEQ